MSIFFRIWKWAFIRSFTERVADEKKVFEYDYVIHHLIHYACSFKGCYRISHRFSVFVWSGENDSYSLRVDAYFLKAEKKNTLRFQAI